MTFMEDLQQFLALSRLKLLIHCIFANTRSMGLTDLPPEIIRSIFDLLDDKNVLLFLHVSRVTRILGLVTLLTRHKIFANADSPSEISLSSGNLGKNFDAITKLTVRHDDVSSFSDLTILTRVCLLLPKLVELDLDIHCLSPSPGGSSGNGLVDLMELLSERRGGISNLLILHDGYWSVAECRRESTKICIFRKDTTEFTFKTPFSLSAALRFEFKSLQPGTFPSWIHENWSLVVFNGNEMTDLTMGHGLFHRPAAKMNCGPALPSVHFPQLRSLQICKKAKLSMADITPFLARHPTIHNLMLNHHSLSPSLSTPGVKWPMPNLTTLEAPLHYLEAILRDIDVRRLSTICIGKRPQGQGNIIERKFNFNTLNRVLETLTNSSATSLMIVLPGGLKSRAWLAAASSSAGTQRAETKMVMVETVTIFTKLDKPFHQGIVTHLRDWSRLFSSINRFWYTIPQDWPSYNEEANNPTRDSAPWRNCKFCG